MYGGLEFNPGLVRRPRGVPAVTNLAFGVQAGPPAVLRHLPGGEDRSGCRLGRPDLLGRSKLLHDGRTLRPEEGEVLLPARRQLQAAGSRRTTPPRLVLHRVQVGAPAQPRVPAALPRDLFVGWLAGGQAVPSV